MEPVEPPSVAVEERGLTLELSTDDEDWYAGWTAASHVTVGLIASGAVVMPSAMLTDPPPAVAIGGLGWGLGSAAFVVPLAGPTSLLSARSVRRHGGRVSLAPGIVATALVPVSEVMMLGTLYGYTDHVDHGPMLVTSAFLLVEAGLVEWQLALNRRARRASLPEPSPRR